ncbi:MAG TPA: xanthine dehydrogenase family protein subunit M [Actinomycetota bacterium]|nr:xanthine dehydrogenase family protein subunit M [Actinomycetota bacterium]
MYPGRFDFHVPDTVEEAVALMATYGQEARVLAGGQSLVRQMRFRYQNPAHLVDLRRLGLSGIKQSAGTLTIGATTTDAVLEASTVLKAHAPLLADVTHVIADPLVRNVGTIGGSAAHAHPSGDWGPALLAARARFRAVGPEGWRTIPADQFFVGSYCTALGPAEILASIEVSGLADGGGAYLKLHRKVGDFATVGVAAQFTVDTNGLIGDCGIGLTGVAMSYARAAKAEEYLNGRHLDRDALRRAGGIAAEETHPVGDSRGSSVYKREMVKVLCTQALVRAAERAGCPLEG